MTYQIDQSGKIEQTEKVTVLAAVNDTTQVVMLSAKEKRRLQELFRSIGKPKLFIDIVFTILLYILIKKINQKKSKIEIDREYQGHEKIIEQMFSTLSKSKKTLNWILIGKTSKAHDVAYKAFSKKIFNGRKISASEVWILAKKITGGRLKIGLPARQSLGEGGSPTNRRSAPVIRNKYNKKNIDCQIEKSK